MIKFWFLCSVMTNSNVSFKSSWSIASYESWRWWWDGTEYVQYEQECWHASQPRILETGISFWIKFSSLKSCLQNAIFTFNATNLHNWFEFLLFQNYPLLDIIFLDEFSWWWVSIRVETDSCSGMWSLWVSSKNHCITDTKQSWGKTILHDYCKDLNYAKGGILQPQVISTICDCDWCILTLLKMSKIQWKNCTNTFANWHNLSSFYILQKSRHNSRAEIFALRNYLFDILKQ